MALSTGEEEQRRQFQLALSASELIVEQVWMAYFGVGGAAGIVEVQAYVHGAMSLPPLERDLLAYALNECLDERGANGLRASYGLETLAGDDDELGGTQSS